MNYWFKGISRRWKDYRLVMIVTFIAAVFMSGCSRREVCTAKGAHHREMLPP